MMFRAYLDCLSSTRRGYYVTSNFRFWPHAAPLG